MDPIASKNDKTEPMEVTDDNAGTDVQPMDLSVRKKNSGSPPPSRPTVVVMQQSAAAAAVAELPDVPKPLLAVPPQIADRAAAASVPSSSLHQPLPFFFADDDGGAAAPLQPQPSSSSSSSSASSAFGARAERMHLLHHRQLGDLDMALHQHQLQLHQQQQQLRFQYHLQQHQLQLASYGDVGGHGALHLDTIMMARQLAAAAQPPPPPPLSASSTDSDPFPFAAFGCVGLPTAIDDFGFGHNNNNTRPYLNGLPGSVGGPVGLPESMASAAFDVHGAAMQPQQRRGVFGAASLQTMGGAGPADGHLFEPDPEEVARIYRSSEFVAFRQRYVDNLGPPRNYEKMRRSAPANRQPPAYDLTYAQKRIKNNEAAKKSRDAKRQKFLENQISVLYLSKKIRELNEMKRRMLDSMDTDTSSN